ncbi:MAG: hypothetical protein VXZ58_02445 [Actinomycetota bacterium]|nr:hypothetical protein [Actinomycetota bacterium]|tara:strand:+ start:400 stop:735 length:336 start_codon:yes stop_codon:yes gene_type:complete
MSHTKVWVMLDDFTRIFKYGGTELGKIINNPWNTNEWTIQPSFSVSCVSQGEIGASKYRSLSQASQALIDLWAAQAAYEASWNQYDDEYDAYQSWIDSVLSGFHLHCGGSD